MNRYLETSNEPTAAPAAPAPAAPTNVIRQGAKALPTLDDRNGSTKKTANENKMNSKGGGAAGNAIDKERIVNIDALNPYMNK